MVPFCVLPHIPKKGCAQLFDLRFREQKAARATQLAFFQTGLDSPLSTLNTVQDYYVTMYDTKLPTAIKSLNLPLDTERLGCGLPNSLDCNAFTQ